MIGGFMVGIDSQEISDIIDKDIIELLDLTSLPEEQKNDFRQKAVDTVNNRIFVRLTNLLDEKGIITQFEDINQNGEEETKKFLEENGISLNQIAVEESAIYKAEMKVVADMVDAGFDVKSQKE